MRHRLDDVIDKKNKPSDEIPDWWISSSWIPTEESDEDDDDYGELFINLINRDNNNDRNNNNSQRLCHTFLAWNVKILYNKILVINM